MAGKGIRCEDPAELDGKIQEMLDYDGPVLFDCLVERDENCLPMIPSGKPHNEMILPDFVEDIGDIIDAKGTSAGVAMRIATLIFGLMLAFGAAAVALGDERLAIPASRFSMAVPEFVLGRPGVRRV